MTPETKSIAEQNAIAKVTSAAWRGVGKSFRGEIYDYARTFTLGSGYLGDWQLTNLCRLCRAKGNIRTCRHFEIDTARHLIGPFKAILDPNVRIVMLLKAAQTAGSLVWDLTVHYLLVHSPYMRVKALMDCEEKARIYCTQRLMETLRKNPDISPLLPTGADRFGVTDTEMRLLNGKTLFVGGLNETNASSLPADVMILDEGWLHQSDGLMGKAVNRVKQSQKRGKLIIVGQAGKVKEDQDLIWEGLHVRVPLTFSCPACGGRQEFNITKQRPNDFAPLPIKGIGEWTIPADPPKPETFWGMKVPERFSELDTPEKIKSAAAKTTIECYHCGSELPDTRKIREAINATFDQEYRQQLPNGIFYTPKNFSVGFWQPDPASMFVPWRETMQAYIVAVKAHKESGNIQKLIDFYLSNWATPWDGKSLSVSNRTITAGTYDPLKYLEIFGKDESGASLFHSVNMAVDCQEDADHKAATEKSITGWFWYIVRAYDRFGNSRQLARGYCKSWAAWRSVQAFWGVPNDRVMIDVVQWSEQVMNKAVEFRQMVKRSRPHPIFKTMEDSVTWKLLAASPGKQNFKGHRDGQIRPWSPEAAVYGSMIDESGKVRRIPLARILFNKTPIMLQIDSLYSGAPGMPKFEFLSRDQLKIPAADGKTLVPDTLTLSMEVDGRNGRQTMLAYENQMSAQIYNKETNKYDELRPDDHWFWCEQALLVRAGMDGLLGQSAVFSAE